MMKGIVADIKGKYAVVLSKDGSFVKVRNNGLYSIGCEIDIGKPAGINTRMLARVSSMAAGALLVMGVSYGAYSYTVPYSLVDVDINPSIEITTNIYDRIIKTEALNEDGQKLLLTVSLKHSRLDEGVTVILNNAIQQGYIKEETAENAVIITVVSKDVKRSEKLQKGLETIAVAELKEEGVKSDLVIGKASQQEHDSAREIGLTPGKLNLIERAIQAEPGLKLEDLKDAPVKDIMKKIKENRKEDKQNQDSKQVKQDSQDNQDSKQVKQDSQDNQDSKQVKQDSQDNQDNKQGKQDSQDNQDNKQGKQGKQDSKQVKQDKQDKQVNNQGVKKNENSDNSDNANTGNGNSDAITEESSTVSGHVVVNDQSGNGKSDNVEGNSKSDNKKDYNNN